jgi:hypothetical protein
MADEYVTNRKGIFEYVLGGWISGDVHRNSY